MAALVKMWVPDRGAFDAVNVGGLRNALAAAAGAAGARLVYTSSFIARRPDAGPSPPTSRRCTRAGLPQRLRAHQGRWPTPWRARRRPRGRDVVILYPGVVYGPGDLTDGNIVVKMVADHLAAASRHRGPGRPALVVRLRGRRGRRATLAALERGRAGRALLPGRARTSP